MISRTPSSAPDGCVKPIKIGDTADIALNSRDVLADQAYCLFKLALAPSRYKDVRTLFNKAPGRGKTYAATPTSNDRHFSV